MESGNVQVSELVKLASGLHLTSIPTQIHRFTQCLPDGRIQTRSFTSLGLYNLRKTAQPKDTECRRTRASASLWEPRSQRGNHGDLNRTHVDQWRTQADAADPYSRETVCVSPNGEPGAPTGSDHSRLHWVDALNSWVSDKRPPQAFVTFVQGAPVRQRAASPTCDTEDSVCAQQCSSDTSTSLPSVDRHGQHDKFATHAGRVELETATQEEDRQKDVHVRRSNTMALSHHISKKRSRVRFERSSRQSLSSSSFPSTPPPSMATTQSAHSNRPSAVTYRQVTSGKTTEDTHKMERLTIPGMFEDVSDKSASVADANSLVSSHKSHSGQGSTSSSAVSEMVSQHSLVSSKSPDPLDEVDAEVVPRNSPIRNPRAVTPVGKKPAVRFISPPRSPEHKSVPSILMTSRTPTPPKIPAPLPNVTVLNQRETTPPVPMTMITKPEIDLDHERRKADSQLRETPDVSEERWGIKRTNHIKPGGTQIMERKKNQQNRPKDHIKLESIETKPPSRGVSPKLPFITEQGTGVPKEDEKLLLNHSHHSSTSSIPKQTTKRKPVVKKVRKQKKVEVKVEVKPKTPSPPQSPPLSLISPQESESRSDICSTTEEEDEVWHQTERRPPESGEATKQELQLNMSFSDMSLPPFPEQTSKSKTKVKSQMSLPVSSRSEKMVKRRKSSVKLSSFEEDRRRQELGEERRKKQHLLLERLRLKANRRTSVQTEEITPQEEDYPRFEDYDFLAKYCIFGSGTYELYKGAFDSVNPSKPWLTQRQIIKALKSLNTKLSQVEDAYLRRILELLGYDVCKGADLKLFSVIAALSKRIAALDPWMKTLMGSLELKTVELKLFLWKTLWECNVNNWKTISVDQLCVELRAGGVSEVHEHQVRHKLSHLKALDLLDFLTYLPLFIMIHESVIDNPLSDRREK